MIEQYDKLQKINIPQYKQKMQVIQRSLSRFNFGTTVALFCGGPQHEKLAGELIQNLKKTSNNSVSFVGVIGDQNAKDFDHVYASSDVLNEHDFDRTRSQQEVISDSILVPYRTLTHIKNNALVKSLVKNNLFDDLSTKRVDCYITVGNFSLSKRIYTALNQHYKVSGKIRPPTFLLDSHISERNVYNEDYLDYIFARLAKQPDNMQKYVFPSMCIGYEGLYRAFQYLQQFKKDPSNSSFLSENFSFDVNELIQKARKSFRQAKGVSQEHYVLTVAPGEKSKEIKFTFTKSIPGLNEFLSSPQIKSINKDFFEVFVILPEDDQAVYEIKAEAAKLPSNLKVHFIDPSEKYGALSAADFGILHNGEITVEAAACQLPATVLDSMNDARAYFEYLFNGHCSPLNVSTNFHGYEELLGGLSVTPAKMAYILTQHFERPKLRYYYAKLYREHIQIMLSRSGQNPNLDVSQSGLQVASKTIIDVANKYKLMDHNVRKTTNERKEALSFEHH